MLQREILTSHFTSNFSNSQHSFFSRFRQPLITESQQRDPAPRLYQRNKYYRNYWSILVVFPVIIEVLLKARHGSSITVLAHIYPTERLIII